MPGAGICWTLSSGFDATILQRWLRLDLEPKAEDQISFQLRQEHPHGLSAGRPPHHKPRDSEPTQDCQISLQVSLKTPHPLPIPTTSKLFPKPHLREQSLPNRTMTKTEMSSFYSTKHPCKPLRVPSLLFSHSAMSGSLGLHGQ